MPSCLTGRRTRRAGPDQIHGTEVRPHACPHRCRRRLWRPWEPQSMEGVRLLLHRKGLTPVGPRRQAKAGLEEGYDRSALTMPALAASCLMQLAWAAVDERDWRQAELSTSRVERRWRPPCRPVRSTALLSMPLLRFSWLGPATGRRAATTLTRHLSEVPTGEAPSVTTVEAQVILARALVLLSDHASARQLLCEARLGSLNYRTRASWPKRQPKPKTSSPLPLPPRRSLTHCRQQRSGSCAPPDLYDLRRNKPRIDRLADDRKNSSHRRVPQARCQVAGRGGQEGPATGIALRLDPPQPGPTSHPASGGARSPDKSRTSAKSICSRR